MLASMDVQELAEWRILDANAAFGERRMDQRFAKMTAHLVAAIPFGGRRTIRVDDYRLGEFGQKPPELDESQDVARFDAGARAHNGAT